LGRSGTGGRLVAQRAWRRPSWPKQDGGETWLSLLLEAPYWIGVPLLVVGGFGALGWLAARGIAPRS
jgi:hypothetical protein